MIKTKNQNKVIDISKVIINKHLINNNNSEQMLLNNDFIHVFSENCYIYRSPVYNYYSSTLHKNIPQIFCKITISESMDWINISIVDGNNEIIYYTPSDAKESLYYKITNNINEIINHLSKLNILYIKE